MLVYLVGPITSESFDQATGWRDFASQALEPQITALSPLRFKGYLKGETSLNHVYENTLSTQKGIYTRDLFDVRRCDAALANFLDADKASIGSCFELAWLALLGKPTVVVMDPENVHNHPFVREAAGFIVPTLEEGIDLIKKILLPESHFGNSMGNISAGQMTPPVLTSKGFHIPHSEEAYPIDFGWVEHSSFKN